MVTSGYPQNTPQTGWRKHRHVSSPRSGGWKSKISVPSGMVSGGASLSGLQTAASSLRPHKAFLRAQHDRDVSGVSCLVIRTPVLSTYGTIAMTSVNLS